MRHHLAPPLESVARERELEWTLALIPGAARTANE
jgi:hypothetical protein